MTTRPSPRILTCLSLALLAWGLVITLGWIIAKLAELLVWLLSGVVS
jgi:hypothetical protein